MKGAVEFALSYPFPQAPVSFRNQVNAIAAFDGRGLAAVPSKYPRWFWPARKTCSFSASAGRELAQKFPRGKYLAIEGAAHSIHAEKPKEFAEAVLSFLKEGDNP